MSPPAHRAQSGILNGGTSQFREEGVCRRGFTEAVERGGLCSLPHLWIPFVIGGMDLKMELK